MANLMDNTHFAQAHPQQSLSQPPNIIEMFQQAQRDPLGFEETVKQRNPEGYKRAMLIRNCANPKAMVLEMAKARGIDPNIISMLGLK